MPRPLPLVIALGLVTASLPAAARVPVPAFQPVLVQLPGEREPDLLGGWAAGWLTPPQAARRLTAPLNLHARTLTGPASPVRTGPARSFGDPCLDAWAVPVQPARALNAFQVFTGPGVTVRPRPVTALPTGNATYRAVVAQELKRRGVANPDVRLRGVTRVDLNGDGRDEVLLEAWRFPGSPAFPPPVGDPGDYSVLLLRHVVGGRAVTQVLAAHVAPAARWDPGSDQPMPMATLHRLAGVADLNGDGRMELLLYGAYYEGYALTAAEWTPTGGLRPRLEAGCGV
ncbi:FG-GAP repeat domain-containing protein [Deinococcus ficus]|uniref:VCBS repeat-containing protein n=1 Tax=Deinococcus ficus TaxID=317577 RepID=A0A221SUD5_9DEIO|nr:VCBS repeat-containing protein [Deinococcus ficus]ASN80266.1 hypothetical protein DFI_03860 [Deinococcus ficus]